MSAKIVLLSDYRIDDAVDGEIDLITAIDAAIRDLREMLAHWGTDVARQRAQECESMLRHVLSGSVNGPLDIR